VSRRGFLGAMLAAAGLVVIGRPAAASARTVSVAVNSGEWVRLPGSDFEVFLTDAAVRHPRTSVRVTWTTDGRADAAFPAVLSVLRPGTVTSSAGYGLALRKVGS
jgi:hypothetical protein